MANRSAETLFLQALQVSGVAREALIDACDDPAVRAEVRELLQSASDAGSFFETPPTLGIDRDEPTASVDAGPPSRIGPFAILDVLGEGGMGVVYLAESEHPRRRVALKVIKPGIASREVLRRFEHETQVLALLQHPGIAAIYEAGTEDTGAGPQPYFAMELIEGASLLEHGKGLTQRAMLELFAKICDAVQHAHSKGVVHRDLKSANIMVDGTGQPKILDFGVARLGEHESQVTSMQTNVGQLIGTLATMSPEQVSGDPAAVDTRSDIYALGVVLYQLLAGTPPLDFSSVSMFEAMRMIREDDPVALGQRERSCRGDLETIAQKALEKERDRRYGTAAQLADDVRRFLRNEPITARPAGTVYQMRKAIRRNPGLVAGASIALVALVVGLVVSLLLLRESIRQQQQREMILAFTDREFFAMADPDHIDAVGDLRFRQVLIASGPKIEEKTATFPAVSGELHLTWGSAFSNLDDLSTAEFHLQHAVEDLSSVYGQDDPRTLEARRALGRVQLRLDKLDEAEIAFGATLERAMEALGPLHVVTLEIDLGLVEVMIERAAESDALLALDAVETRIAQAAADPPDDETAFQLWQCALTAQRLRATCLRRQGELAEAERLFRAVYEGRRDQLGSTHASTLVSADLLSTNLRQMGLYEEAIELLTATLAAYEESLPPTHDKTLTARANLGRTFFQHGRAFPDGEIRQEKLARARELLDEVHAIRARTSGPTASDTLRAKSDVASVRVALEEFGEAEPLFRALLAARLEQHPDEDHISVGIAYNNLSVTIRRRILADPANAITVIEEERAAAAASYDLAQKACDVSRRLGLPGTDQRRVSFEITRAIAGELAERDGAYHELTGVMRLTTSGSRQYYEIARALERLCTREGREEEAEMYRHGRT